MKFAVIEGIDGSGKSTQIAMLQDYLNSKKILYKYLHFPRMETGIYGELIARFLRGELGSIEQVNPYLVALIYAGDRTDAAPMINRWFEEGNLIIVDRYVFSNIAYQCAKLENAEEKEKLKNWILNLEYNYNKIPKPDVNIFFDVPFQFTKDRLSRTRKGEDRSYLQGSKDIHEADIDFQAKVRETYVNLSKTEPSLKLINCSKNEMMMKPEEIFSLLISNLEAAGIL